MLTDPSEDGLAAAVLYNHLDHAGEKKIASERDFKQHNMIKNGKCYFVTLYIPVGNSKATWHRGSLTLCREKHCSANIERIANGVQCQVTMIAMNSDSQLSEL